MMWNCTKSEGSNIGPHDKNTKLDSISFKVELFNIQVVKHVDSKGFLLMMIISILIWKKDETTIKLVNK